MTIKKTVRIYKRFDYDLYTIYTAGYNMAWMIRDAVCALVQKKPLRIRLDEKCPDTQKKSTSVKITVTFKNASKELEDILTGVKDGYVSSFCKAALRTVLINQNIQCFTKEMIRTDMYDEFLSDEWYVRSISQYKGRGHSKLENKNKTKDVNPVKDKADISVTISPQSIKGSKEAQKEKRTIEPVINNNELTPSTQNDLMKMFESL